MAKIEAGQHVLINGASGSLGTAAIQIAKVLGAEVTAVCSQTNIDLVKSLGADHTIDYNQNDYTKNHNAYDVIYDTVGKSSFCSSRKALKQRGKYLSPVLSCSLLGSMLRTSIVGKKKAKFQATGMRKPKELNQFLTQINDLIEQGKLSMVVEKRYAIEEIAEAHEHVDSGRKKGNVVLVFR